jgi:hypothetical protein
LFLNVATCLIAPLVYQRECFTTRKGADHLARELTILIVYDLDLTNG